jgi:hypothetical protein
MHFFWGGGHLCWDRSILAERISSNVRCPYSFRRLVAVIWEALKGACEADLDTAKLILETAVRGCMIVGSLLCFGLPLPSR